MCARLPNFRRVRCMGHGRSDLGGLATTNLTYSAPWNSAGQVLVETPVVAVGGAYTEISRVWSPL